jgi:transposase
MKEELNKETLKRLYVVEQKSLREIAKMFGRSYAFVHHRCKKYRMELRLQGRRVVGLNKSVLQRLCVREGKSAKKIAEMFSCSPITVRNRCREYDIALKKKARLSRTVLQQLYVKNGKTIREIAKILGCSREKVRLGCKQFGIPLRPVGIRTLER